MSLTVDEHGGQIRSVAPAWVGAPTCGLGWLTFYWGAACCSPKSPRGMCFARTHMLSPTTVPRGCACLPPCSGLRRDVDSLRSQLSGLVEPAAAPAEEEEVSSQPGKRRRQQMPAAAAGTSAAAGPSVAAPQLPAAPAASPVPPAAAPYAGSIVLPSDAEVRRLLVQELLRPTEGQDTLELSRTLKDQLLIPISNVGDLTKLVGAAGERGGGSGWGQQRMQAGCHRHG